MTYQDTLPRLLTLLNDQLLNVDRDATLESNLVTDLGADSLDVVELVMATEEEFDIEINDEDAAELHTVGDLVAHIDTLRTA